MDYDQELERYRLEFVKRSQDAAAVYRTYRTEKAFERHQQPALVIHDAANPAKQQSREFYDSPEWHGYTLTITFNMYATTEEIKAALLSQVIGMIEISKKLMALDIPESEKPKLGPWDKGGIQELEKCLLVHDLLKAGKDLGTVAEEVYKVDRESQGWKSAYEKTLQHRDKAKRLIEAAINGEFPSKRTM